MPMYTATNSKNTMSLVQQDIPSTQNLHKSMNTWNQEFTLTQPNIHSFHAETCTKQVLNILHFYTATSCRQSVL